IELMSRITVPPRSIITELISSVKQQYLDGYNSIRVPNETTPLPLWAIRFWNTLHLEVEPRRSAWSAGVNWLQASSIAPAEIHKTLDALMAMPWTDDISAGPGRSSFQKHSLAQFLSRYWLGDEQMDHAASFLERKLRAALPSREVFLLDTVFTRTLMHVYREYCNGTTPR
ncbi:hypothetical protein DXG01_006871, partial [Tephrocybe rancida]